MNISKYLTVILIMVSFATLFAQGNETFYLKSGEKIIGIVIDKDDYAGTITVETQHGRIKIKKSDLRITKVEVSLKTGEVILGDLLKEDKDSIQVKTNYGEIFISSNKINSMKFLEPAALGSGVANESESKWYYGDERLIDIFFDPTGYTLENNILYLSGLSWGYGLTQRIQITSSWAGYLVGDVNIRPKIQILRMGNIKSEKVISVGGHLHTRGMPDKHEYYEDDKKEPWHQVGYNPEDPYNDGDKLWYEIFGAATISNLKKSGQGRTNYTLGGSVVSYPGYDPLPRVYGAVTVDARKNLKLLFEVFYDPYHMSWFDLDKGTKSGTSLGMDAGFIYAFDEQKRIGLHYGRPSIAIYYKF